MIQLRLRNNHKTNKKLVNTLIVTLSSKTTLIRELKDKVQVINKYTDLLNKILFIFRIRNHERLKRKWSTQKSAICMLSVGPITLKKSEESKKKSQKRSWVPLVNLEKQSTKRNSKHFKKLSLPTSPECK
jgi:hypothetical protein